MLKKITALLQQHTLGQWWLRLAVLSAGSVFSVILSSASLAEYEPLTLPDIGDSSENILSKQEGSKIGREAYRQFRRQEYILDDPESGQYLQQLGERLAVGAGDPDQKFTFFLVPANNINAFAMPGGYIGINTGLITAAADESELAGVIGHEITHVTQRHIARVLEATKNYDLATAALVLAALVLGGGDGQLAQAALSAGLASSIERRINFTRAHEHEADRLGIQLLANAGLDPYGMPRFFERLEQQSRYYQTDYPDFLRTHPVTTTRIVEAKARADRYPKNHINESEQFLFIRERLKVLIATSAEYPLSSYQPAPDPKLEPHRAYGHGIALLRAGHNRESVTVFEQLLAQDQANLLSHLGLATAHLANGDTAEAKRSYALAERLFPGNPVLEYRHAEALVAMNEPLAARNLLQSLRSKQPDDPNVYRLLAVSSAETDRPVDALIFTSEYHYLNGRTRLAIEQLETARGDKDLSPQDRSRLDEQRKRLKARKREES